MINRREQDALGVIPQALASDQSRVRAALHAIAQALGDPHVAEKAAAAAGISVVRLDALLQGTLGLVLADYILQERMRYAMRVLVESSRSVSDIARDTGFASVPAFTAAFRRHAGMSPLVFRREAPIMPLTSTKGGVHWG